jgi:threonine dehydrogenase-like Zn-dependent dehydrogenase
MREVWMQKTKAIVLKEPGKLKVEVIPVPKLGEPAKLMKVKACGVCGSDVRYLRGENSWALLTLGKENVPNPKNIILGHEMAGVIEEDGRERPIFANIRKGCQICEYCMDGREELCANLRHYGHGAARGKMDYYPGGMSEYTEVWADRIHFLPEDVDFEAAALIEPTCIAVHGVRSAGVQSGQEIVVIGLGPIGLLLVQIAKHFGVERIFGIDIDDTPLKKAEQLGCDEVIDARRHDPLKVIRERTHGKGVDVVLSSVDKAEDITKGLSMVKRGGTLLLQYGPHGDIAFPFKDLCGEKRIVTAVGYSEAEQGFSIKLVSHGRIDSRALITHRFSLDEAEQAFEVAANKEKYKAIVVMIKP